MNEFRPQAPSAETVFYRTYSRRKTDGTRENFKEAMLRTVNDIAAIGQYTQEEYALVREQALKQRAFPSGRAFWVAGTDWSKRPENFSGYYNCTSTHIEDLNAFGLLVDLAMQGSGTGAVLEQDVIDKLPEVQHHIEIYGVSPVGGRAPGRRDENTSYETLLPSGIVYLTVGDSRQGWRDAYQFLVNLAHRGLPRNEGHIRLHLDLSHIRPSGERLKGFGGTSNPVKLEDAFRKVVDLLNGAKGRRLTSVEACLLIDEAAACIVAGNIRRSAGMRQFSADDQEAATAKLGLYTQDDQGNWRVDPVKENLRMANHTRCFHTRPTLEQVKEAVTLQCQSGEGAIEFVPEAIARSNADLLNTETLRRDFIDIYVSEGRQGGIDYIRNLAPDLSDRELNHRIMRYGLNPCGEILGEDFHCNLAEVHLNTLDPNDHEQQADAFRAAALEVSALLQHQFKDERYAYSRSIDPIVGVSFTGLFDFFMAKWGASWLSWMFAGRPQAAEDEFDYAEAEAGYLRFWRQEVEVTVKQFCEARDLRVPNRTTTVQPAGTKSLLTGASSGWHPPKAQRFIRRITFGAGDPVALAAIDAGYSVVPAPSARDDEGNLLDDINDPRSTEWLIEIPTEVPWANLPGVDEFDLAKLPAVAQFGLWLNVQQAYTAHNTSATIELREDEIDDLAQAIFDSIEDDQGYISAALLQRFDASGGTFPRLPFEPIDKATYDRLSAAVKERKQMSFRDALDKYDDERELTPQESACTSAACVAAADKADREGRNT